jgi:N-acetylmuramoyl-L-alanine amidase
MWLDAFPDPDPTVWLPPDLGVHRVVVDPGHGEPGNTGNRDCLCTDEADFTLPLAEELAARLEASGHFEVRTTRPGGAQVPYAARIEAAGTWGAEALVSLHSDTRGAGRAWETPDGSWCTRNDAEAGFTVLWSDEGPLAPARERLAEAMARRMAEAGFAPYSGAVYGGLYEQTAPAVFVDRHAPAKRIRMLRRPTMPSILVETHHAWNLEEATRWRQGRVRAAFADAVLLALADVLHPRSTYETADATTTR